MINSSYIEYLYENPPFGWKGEDPNSYHYFAFEALDPLWWHNFVITHDYYAVYASVIYLVTIFGIQKWMQNRKPFGLRMPLFLWNTSLGIFSILGFTRSVPGFVNMLSKQNGFYNSICVRSDMTIPMAYWGLMFSLSKFVELGDTVFLALRKKPLVFLQWYHHLITMCSVWILVPYLEPVTRWYSILNFGVHSLMYPYFAMKAIDVKIPRQVANAITTAQLVQMIAGLFMNMLTMYYYQTGDDCFRYPISIKVFGFVYASFFVLFGKLFYDSVIMGGRSRQEKPNKTD